MNQRSTGISSDSEDLLKDISSFAQSFCRVAGSNQEPPGLVAAGARWMKKVNDLTKLPDGMLSVQLFVPDMFGNDILLTRQRRHAP